MVTRLGEGQFMYDNLNMGFAKNENDPDSIIVVMTDKDNEEVHLFPVALSKFEQWVNLGRQTAAGQQIEVAGAGDMPRPPQGA